MGLKDILIVPFEENSFLLKDVKCMLITEVGEKKAVNIGDFITLAQDGDFIESGHIHEFLEKSKIEFVTTPIEPRNPELEARVLKLRVEQENREYRKMVKGLGGSTEPIGASIRTDVKQITSQITAVINFVLTVIGTFFFTYKAVEYALPESNIPAQVLMGIITSTIVALADLFFLARTI